MQNEVPRGEISHAKTPQENTRLQTRQRIRAWANKFIRLFPHKKSEVQEKDLLDMRQRNLLQKREFIGPYQTELRELMHALGKDEFFPEDPTNNREGMQNLASYMVGAWAGGEHGNSPDKEQFNREETAQAREILQKMGLIKEILPPENAHYDDVLIVGGTMVANYRRLQFVLDLMQSRGLQADTITFLLGQRLREVRDGTIEELLATTGRFAGNDIGDNPWVKEELQKPPEEQFATETDIGRVALLKVMPEGSALMPLQIDREESALNDSEDIPGVPKRDVVAYHFEVVLPNADGTMQRQKIVLLNAKAVMRPHGAPRHTTASSVNEWVQRYSVKEKSERILLLSGNPHTIRTGQDSLEVLQNAGRGDIYMDIAGTSMTDATPIQNALGEVAWLTVKDLERNYSSNE